eukprot:SM000318S12235  [mRNA]  locus=s318:102735:103398:- [translate_table: standard]
MPRARLLAGAHLLQPRPLPVCLRHQFGNDHACAAAAVAAAPASPAPRSIGGKFLEAFARRKGADCAPAASAKSGQATRNRESPPSVRAR